MDYKEQLLQAEWIEKASHIRRLHGLTCQRCKDSGVVLHVHHKYYDLSKMAWEYPDDAFECLCEHCHTVEHIPNCCNTPYFDMRYDKECRMTFILRIRPNYCPVCGTPIPEH